MKQLRGSLGRPLDETQGRDRTLLRPRLRLICAVYTLQIDAFMVVITGKNKVAANSFFPDESL